MKRSTLFIALLVATTLSGCNLFDDDDNAPAAVGNGNGNGTTTPSELQTLGGLQADDAPAILTDIIALQAQLKASFGGPDDDPVPISGSDTVTSLIGTP